MEKKITIGNVCFLIDRHNEKILLLHRNKDPMKNLCTGVGGKTEFHEDIHHSCIREVFEETGLQPTNIRLKGVLKTLVEGGSSSWVLFAYTGECSSNHPIQPCDEGILEWVPYQEVSSKNLIGFIRKILPHILNEESFFEGTIVHDMQGHVLQDTIKIHCLERILQN